MQPSGGYPRRGSELGAKTEKQTQTQTQTKGPTQRNINMQLTKKEAKRAFAWVAQIGRAHV